MRFDPNDGAALVPIAAFLVVWFTIMGLTGWLAGKRGRSSGDWALLALITGPLALLLVVVLPRGTGEAD